MNARAGCDRLARLAVAALALLASAGLAQDAAPADRDEAAEPVSPAQSFPHMEIDAKAREIRLDAIVPIDAHHDDTPRVYLEVIVCSPDTREHETLAMTHAKPSHIHAALLLLGLKPGAPGSWRWEDDEAKYTKPTGDAVEVLFRWKDAEGKQRETSAREWVVNAETGERLPDEPWVFAGSRMVTRGGREVYDADGAGNIVGLATFANETIAWSRPFSPESEVDEPVWIANREIVPKYETPVTVVLRPAKPAAEADAD